MADSDILASAAQVAQDGAVGDLLFALSHPVRLALLGALQEPKCLADIQVETRAGGPRKPISRQAIRVHLERLLDARLVVPLSHDGDRRRGPRYLANPPQVYRLAEAIRLLSRLQPGSDVVGETLSAPRDVDSFDLHDKALIMVKGPHEGRAFAIEPPLSGTRHWTIGRRRGSDITLDHDAYVSGENTRILWADGVYSVVDLPTSKNGTRLNFKVLPRGQVQHLCAGDLIGVGQTLLLFRA